MKKTFRRRAPRKGTRKRTYGGRKLRKMRGGWVKKGDWEIEFTESEKKQILEYKKPYDSGDISVVNIYAKIFGNNKGKDMENRFVYSMREILSDDGATHSGNGQGGR
jgi:hypothetical protein